MEALVSFSLTVSIQEDIFTLELAVGGEGNLSESSESSFLFTSESLGGKILFKSFEVDRDNLVDILKFLGCFVKKNTTIKMLM